MNPLLWIDDQLDRLENADLLRKLPPSLRTTGALVEINGSQVINFASNDYLGLAADQRLIDAAINACRKQGIGRGASPLVSGRSELHDQLENRLAQFFATEAALLFPTSFAANAGIIPTLVDHGDAIYGDEKNHASIIDGCRLSHAKRHIYPHTNIEALEKLLEHSNNYRRRLIITDSLFSMDGDLAPLPQLAALAEKYNAMLMVDEAHAIGVFGKQGRGVAEHFNAEDRSLEKRIHVRVGTFAKALGSAGGFVYGSSSLIRWLANRARTYVFSTAHPAPICAAGLVALDLVHAEPERRITLLENAQQLRERLQQLDWNTGSSVSQIIPLRIGSPARTMNISQQLCDHGIWASGIRPPSVPPNQSLLRLGITAAHTPQMLDSLVSALTEVHKIAK